MNYEVITIGKNNEDNIVDFLDEKVNTLFENSIFFIILDFKDINFIPSRAISTIANFLKTARKNNGEIAVINIEANIRKIFDITKMYKIIKLMDSKDEALNYFKEI